MSRCSRWAPPMCGLGRFAFGCPRADGGLPHPTARVHGARPGLRIGQLLYLGLHALKDLEHRVQLEAETLGLERSFPAIGPANVKGIEINAYAAELARVSVWIGEIQWMRRNGFAEARNPILKHLHTIECRDAILAPDGTEATWPEADVVIGNPPFVGGKLLITHLGEEYVSRLLEAYTERVPAEADLVCYWFEKAGRQIESRQTVRAGLVATNSIRGGANRRALQAATADRRIFEAWSDEEWVVDGAAVPSVTGLLLELRRQVRARMPPRRRDRGRDSCRSDGGHRLHRCPPPHHQRRRRVHGRHQGRALRRGRRSGAPVADGAEPERKTQRRRLEAVDERQGRDPPARGEMDRRLRLHNVRQRRPHCTKHRTSG